MTHGGSDIQKGLTIGENTGGYIFTVELEKLLLSKGATRASIHTIDVRLHFEL